MCSVDRDTKQFLQFFVDDYINKLILLRHIFKIEYLIIVKYMEPPKQLTIEKFHQCKVFIDYYNDILDLYVDKYIIYDYICNAIDIIKLYFGGRTEYNKIENILKNIHDPHITKGLSKLNKIYPNIFPKTWPSTVFFYKLYFNIEFSNTSEYFYRLIYRDYNWSLYKIINNTCETLFNTVAIEKILVYFHSILRKP